MSTGGVGSSVFGNPSLQESMADPIPMLTPVMPDSTPCPSSMTPVIPKSTLCPSSNPPTQGRHLEFSTPSDRLPFPNEEVDGDSCAISSIPQMTPFTETSCDRWVEGAQTKGTEWEDLTEPAHLPIPYFNSVRIYLLFAIYLVLLFFQLSLSFCFYLFLRWPPQDD